MEFTIYSIGDAVFLAEIINSVAAIAGTGNITMLAMIGGLIGVIIIMVQSLFQGAQQINFQHIFLGWIIFAAMFGPKTTVLIEDVYSGTVHVVDNAPLGIGVAGGMISKIGYNISEIFEQGYGAIEASQTKRRYMEAIEILNEIHRNGNDSSIFTAWNYSVGSGADLRLSWQNYIRECSLLNVDTGVYSVDQMMKLPIEEALKFESSIYGTRLYLTDSNGQDMTCTEGYAALTVATANIKNNPDVYNAVNRILGYSPEISPDQPSPLEKTSRALDSLGAIQTDAFDFLKTSVLEPIYMEAVEGRHQDLRDYSSAIMLNQAIQQRNIQWASEQSMFMTVARPLMTFFEGFIYAVTPVLAFLIMLGGFGLQLAIKYMQSLLWIQLWMPTLAITNLYIHNSVSYEMASKLNVGSEPMNSMYALNSAADILGNWIAVGGMLAAATPIISLFFVTGSTYAFTSLAQRIGGSDHVDEKQMAPDVTKSGAYLQGAPAHMNDQVRGMIGSGAESLISSSTFGQNLSSGISSASALQSQKSEAFSNALGKAFSSATSSEQMYSQSSALGRSLSSSNDDAVQALRSHVKQYMTANNISDSDSDALLGAVAVNAAGGVAVGGRGGGGGGSPVSASLGLSGNMTSQSSDSRSLSSSELGSIADGANLSISERQSLTKAISQVSTDTSSDSFRNSLSESDSQNLIKTASDLNSSSETYSQLESLQESAGSALNSNMFTLGSQVAQSPEASSYLNQQFLNSSQATKQEAAALEERYKAPVIGGEGYGMSPDTAKQAARLTALTNAQNNTPGELSSSYSVAATAIGIATGRNMGVDTNPDRNAGIQAPDHNAKGDVQSGLGSVQRQDTAHVRAMAGTSVDGTDQVNASHNNQYDKTVDRGEFFSEQVSAGDLQAAENRLISGGTSAMSSAASIMGGGQQAAQAVSTWGSVLGNAYFSEGLKEAWETGDLAKGTQKAQRLVQQEQDNFHAGMIDVGMNKYNLTENQAKVFASSLGTSPERYENAVNNLRADYADGFDNRGQPILSERNEALVQSMANQITKAAHTGPAAVGSTMLDVNRVNIGRASLMK